MKKGEKYILGALGVYRKTEGKYQETRYRLGDKLSQPTPLFMHALVEFFPDHHPVFLVTEEAEKQSWALVREVFRYDPEKISVPDGKSETELWEIIGKILGKVQPGTQLILDITHGFRSMPLLILQAGFLLQAMGTAEIEGVFYGAFEARDATATPVFDLTPLLNLNAWTSALATLSNLGQARPLTDQIDKVTVPVFKGERPLPKRPEGLRRLSKTLKNLSDALHTLRSQEIFKHSKKLNELLPQAEGELEYFPEFRALVPLLQPSFKRLAALAPTRPGGFEDAAGLEALARTIRFYIETEAYAKAIIFAREALVSLVAFIQGHDHTNRDAREKAEDWLNSAPRGGEVSEELRDLVKTWSRLHDLRNDVSHAGFRSNPRNAQGLAKEASECGEDTAEHIESWIEKKVQHE